MIQVTINNTPQVAFLLARGEVNDIIIPVQGLHPIDIIRLKKIERRAGNMMENMRDFTLENGVNALKCYQDLIRTVPSADKVVAKKRPEPQERQTTLLQESTDNAEAEAPKETEDPSDATPAPSTAPARRGGGRTKSAK